MKFFVTGAGGLLGYDIMNALALRGYKGIGSGLHSSYSGIHDGTAVCAMPYISMDITRADTVSKVMSNIRPDVVIHCGAWTRVDDAESPEHRNLVRTINAGGTQNVARACRKLRCKMIYISTDYVFSGCGDTPWQPDCQDFYPLNLYGCTKLAGEQAITATLDHFFIIRVSWLFGKNGKNFVRTMLNAGKTHNRLTVVCDQIGTPTYTRDLASLIIDMAETEKYGYYHVTNTGGFISWYDFAEEIFRQAAALGRKEYSQKYIQVIPVTTAKYGFAKAARPLNSRLDKNKLTENGFSPLPPWPDALHRYLQEVIDGI